MTHSLNAMLKVVEVLIECIAVKLDAGELVDGRGGDTERLLQTLEYALAISVRLLRT